MVAIIKNNFRLLGAKQLTQSITDSSTTDATENYYLFVGKPLPWKKSPGTITSTNADLMPPLPADTLFEEKRIWDEMLGLKKILASDVSLVIPRSNWTSRTIYATFDDNDSNLYSHPTLEDVQSARSKTTAEDIAAGQGYLKAGNFYALNSLNDLFVCISNNNGTPSTEEPKRTGDPTSVISSTDGYVWKYITSVSSGDAVKFLTDAWIPVRNIPDDSLQTSNNPQAQVQLSAKAGELLTVVVDSPTASSVAFINSNTASQVTITGTTTATVTSSPVPANNAYAGYQLHITNDSNILNIFDISSYVYASDENTITITGNFFASGFSTGTLYSCKILPKLVVYSNGTEAPVCEPVLDALQHVVGVSIKNSGQDATFVSITAKAPSDSSGFTGTDLPAIRPILSPLSGLGKNPEKDLGAFFVMISTQVRYDDGQDVDSSSLAHLSDFPVKNDYRQIGILKNACKNTSDSIPLLADETTLRATKRLKVKFLSESDLGQSGNQQIESRGFESDELISSPNTLSATANLMCVDFRILNKEGDFWIGEATVVQTPETGYSTVSVGDTLEGSNSSAKATILEISDAEVKKFSGDILYIENRRPIIRSIDQIEDIKTIIEF